MSIVWPSNKGDGNDHRHEAKPLIFWISQQLNAESDKKNRPSESLLCTIQLDVKFELAPIRPEKEPDGHCAGKQAAQIPQSIVQSHPPFADD
jgi:hypothetical protein